MFPSSEHCYYIYTSKALVTTSVALVPTWLYVAVNHPFCRLIELGQCVDRYMGENVTSSDAPVYY